MTDAGLPEGTLAVPALPFTPDDEPQLLVLPTDHGPVILAWSTLDGLVDQLGDRQPWLALAEDDLRTVAQGRRRRCWSTPTSPTDVTLGYLGARPGAPPRRDQPVERAQPRPEEGTNRSTMGVLIKQQRRYERARSAISVRR